MVAVGCLIHAGMASVATHLFRNAIIHPEGPMSHALRAMGVVLICSARLELMCELVGIVHVLCSHACYIVFLLDLCVLDPCVARHLLVTLQQISQDHVTVLCSY